MAGVFITRDLQPDSRFREILERQGYTVFGQYLIDFHAVPFSVVPNCDWIFFYSSKGVHYFFEGLKKANLLLSDGIQLAALGLGTASALKDRGKEVAFTGSGEPEQTARQFLQMAKGKIVLFPHAEHSRRSVQYFLGTAIQAIDLVVYKNKPKTTFKRPPVNCVVFTSPLNVRAFFKTASSDLALQWIAIGATTAAALEEVGVTQFTVAEAASEEGLAKAVLSMG